MEKGRVKERGKHAELIKIKNGIYKKMVDLQHAGLLDDA
jgi:ABC-type multidrug transport system fused ATPase/permease subunit